MYQKLYLRLGVRVKFEGFRINYLKYMSFLGAILYGVDKAYLVLSCVRMVEAGVKVKSDNSDILW